MGIISKTTWRMSVAFGLCLLVILAACTPKKEKKPEDEPKKPEWQTMSERAVSATPVPMETTADDTSVLEDSIEIEAAGETETGKRLSGVPARALPTLPVSMEMHDVSLPVLIRTLARVADIDIVINESVQGQTKMTITNVPWDQVFTGILDSFGLTYEWSGDILRVVTTEDLEKKLKLLEAKHSYEDTRNKHELALLRLEKAMNDLEPLVTKIVKINYTDLEALQKTLSQYLARKGEDSDGDSGGGEEKKGFEFMFKSSQSESGADAGSDSDDASAGGKIMIDEFSSSIILHATRSEIRKLMPIIRRLDQPSKQVRIEAYIVEVDSSVGRELGVQWGGLLMKSSGDENVWVGGPMGNYDSSLLTDEDDENPGSPIVHLPNIGNMINLQTDSAQQGGRGMNLGLMFETFGKNMLTVQLSALQEEGKLNILSNPSITTLDHRKAIIKSGKEIPFQSVIDDEVNIEFKEAVIKLEVTPHIVNNNIIRLEIITHKDELDFVNDVNGYPTIITKNAETHVTLFNGQTTVIGGLTKEKQSDTDRGIPYLQDVPGLGRLFKSSDKEKEMEELMIFITPYILEEKTIRAVTQ